MFLLNPPFIWGIFGFSLATSWNHFPALITGHPGSPIKSQVVGCCGLHHYPSAHGIIDRQRPQAMQKNLEEKEFGNGKLTNLGWGNTLGILRWGSTDFNSGFPRLKRDQCEKNVSRSTPDLGRSFFRKKPLNRTSKCFSYPQANPPSDSGCWLLKGADEPVQRIGDK